MTSAEEEREEQREWARNRMTGNAAIKGWHTGKQHLERQEDRKILHD